MPLCPTSADLTEALLIAGGAVATLAGMIGHGVLRPLLEARGVTPWTLKDSLGSMPLILIGSAMVGGSVGGGVLFGFSPCSGARWAVGTAIAVGLLGLLIGKLGLVELRKVV